MRQKSQRESANLVGAVIDRAAPLLPERDVLEARQLLDHNEWGEAIELICTQLYEHEAVVPPELIDGIRVAGASMGLTDEAWPYLQELLAD